MLFANGKWRAQVSSHAQDDANGSGCHAGHRRTKLGRASAFGHGGYSGFGLTGLCRTSRPHHVVRFIIIAGSVLVIATAGCGPATPKDGFAGDWKPKSVFPIETRPLPPASNVWADFKQWRSEGQPPKDRYYLARIGGTDRQRNLDVSYLYGDTPMGGSTYTSARFGFLDATNGDYTLTWMMRGRHKPEFLRFTSTVRTYYLVPHGTDDELPPQLAIVAIEGVSPFR